MKSIPDEKIDLVITDPPFAINFKDKKANYNRTASRVLSGYNEIKAEDYYDFTHAWMSEILRILKKSGSMYVFSGWNNLKDVLTALDDIGFTTVNHIIWKYQFGVVTTKKFVTSHYHCLYVCKDNKKRKFFPYSRFEKNAKTSDGRSLHYRDKEDVWNIKREYWIGDDKTPTKLPAEIIQKIIQYSSEKKDLVFDPFLGSGQVAVVSKMMGRRYLGFEIVKAYFNFANKRLTKNIYRLKNPLFKYLDMKVEKLTKTDREDWQSLYRGYADFYQMPMNEDILNSVWLWIFDANIKFYSIGVKTSKGKLIGFMHYREMPSPLRGSLVGFLDDLYVHPDHRGTGAVQLLFKELKRIAKKMVGRMYAGLQPLTTIEHAQFMIRFQKQ